MIGKMMSKKQVVEEDYFQLLFEHFVSIKKGKEMKIIQSEFQHLEHELIKLLLVIQANDVIVLGPFMQQLTTKDKVKFANEFEWTIKGVELQKFKHLNIGAHMESVLFQCDGVAFVFIMRRLFFIISIMMTEWRRISWKTHQ
jgi:hypothetical protein